MKKTGHPLLFEFHLDLGDKATERELLQALSEPLTQYIRETHDHFHVEAKSLYEWDFSDAKFDVVSPKSGSYQAPHIHEGSQISGAYYISAEDPPETRPSSGRLDFIDQEKIEIFSFLPKRGTLFLFPSELLHWVHPYYGKNDCTCFSFNVNKIR